MEKVYFSIIEALGDSVSLKPLLGLLDILEIKGPGHFHNDNICSSRNMVIIRNGKGMQEHRREKNPKRWNPLLQVGKLRPGEIKLLAQGWHKPGRSGSCAWQRSLNHTNEPVLLHSIFSGRHLENYLLSCFNEDTVSPVSHRLLLMGYACLSIKYK